jgi:hypothetical protein
MQPRNSVRRIASKEAGAKAGAKEIEASTWQFCCSLMMKKNFRIAWAKSLATR